MDFQPTALVGALGFGGLAGLVVGFVLKKLAKLLAVLLGLLFVLLQVLAYYKFIHVDWQAITAAASPTAGAAEATAGKLKEILVYNLPFAGGFGLGFLIGFKRG